MPTIDNRAEFPSAWTDGEFQIWVREQMNDERCWLLAHADDGVIWGRWDGNALVTSHEVAPTIAPHLRLVTLQQLFLFGSPDEVRLWRDDDCPATRWRTRRLSDSATDDVINEPHILWGSKREEWPEGFDGRQFTHVWEEASNFGMHHFVPIHVTSEDLTQRRLRLLVRHYITHDQDTGEARITHSRLASLEVRLELQPAGGAQ